MGMPQLVVRAVLVEGRNKSEVARDYGLCRRWVVTLVQRYLAEGDAGLRPRPRRPLHSPNRTGKDIEDEVIALRKELERDGHEAGADAVTLTDEVEPKSVGSANSMPMTPTPELTSESKRIEVAFKPCAQQRLTGVVWVPRGRRDEAFHKDLAGGRFEVLVQQPDCEALKCIGKDEVLAQFVETGAIVLAQHSHVGGVHVAQRDIILNVVIPHS
jgi:Helix-turn-helix domain